MLNGENSSVKWRTCIETALDSYETVVSLRMKNQTTINARHTNNSRHSNRLFKSPITFVKRSC